MEQLLLEAQEFIRDELDCNSLKRTKVSTSFWEDDVEFEVIATSTTDTQPENEAATDQSEECSEMNLPEYETVGVPTDSTLHGEIKTVFNLVESNLELRGVEVSSVCFAPTMNHSNLPEGWPNYDETEASSYFSIGIVGELPDDVKSFLMDCILTELQEIDPDITADNILDWGFSFSDAATCELVSSSGHIETPHPERYFDIDSREEYITTVADDASEEQQLRDQETYEILFGLDSVETDPPESVAGAVETRMLDYIETTLSTEYEYRIEAETFQIGGDGYTEYDDLAKYYINIPVVGDTIGRTFE